ncbi:MAG TPA: DPP IV N-terminal domain-containing protein [Pyrinomonadaceae bacterium]|nr:DPP IV N-terminal domain-containing protein [Pyrinomonadaceae bacterium]
MKSVIFTLLLIVLAQATISAQNSDSPVPNRGGTFYTVNGNIKADGVNLKDAAVFLVINGNITESTLTDANGNYSLNAIEGNEYTAGVYKNGFNFNPTFQVLGVVQQNQTVNFQNGVRLCVPASLGQIGEILCKDSAPTSISTIENGRIAFEIFGNAFAINADGTNQMQLPPAGSFPSWSFDGTKLLYNRTTSLDPDQEIYITNADGTRNRQITFNSFNDYKPRWSPDGTRAVFFRLFNTSDIEIFTINTDSPNNGINEIRLTDDDCLNRDPSYSPDGTKIVFSKFCADETASGIYTMDTDGANPFQLTVGSDISPAWRPDGTRIVFARNGNLWIVNSTGTSVVQLTFDLQFSYYSPVYSPDGEKIAFTRSPSDLEFQEIYTLNPISGEQIRLTNNQTVPLNKEYPSWQRVVRNVGVTLVGGVNLNFSNVITAGNTVATPINPLSAGILPNDFTLIPESVAFDVRTSAVFTSETEVCFDLPSINNENLFNSLVIFHNENGQLVDRTSSRNFAARRICATVSSLSPFVIAAPIAPTAANVTVSGRISTSEGTGLGNVLVLMTDSNGISRSTQTSSFGYFRFEGVAAGQTYIFGVRSRRFQFAPQVVNVTADIQELQFIAEHEN